MLGSPLFRNRWSAALWAGGIVWFAAAVAEDAPHANPHATAPAPAPATGPGDPEPAPAESSVASSFFGGSPSKDGPDPAQLHNITVY